MLIPVNDYFLVEIEKPGNDLGLNLVGGANPEDGVREGKVISMSETPVFFGANTFMFDKSLMDTDLLGKVVEHYKDFVGKKVYWPERSESGALIQDGDKTYAFIKWSSIMAVEE